jgi:uncharacterized protein (DUF1330 family)
MGNFGKDNGMFGKKRPDLIKFNKNRAITGSFAEKGNPNWKGGKIVNPKGYILIRKSKHPKANNGYVFEHILIMENHIGRYLIKGEVVHHINGIRSDNRIENLKILTKKQHQKLHFLKRLKKNPKARFFGRNKP